MKYFLGIDLGGTNIAAGVVNEDKEILARDSRPTQSERGAEAVIDAMAESAKAAVEKAGLTLDDMEWVGIGCPGTANKSTGVIEYSNNLDWHDVPLVQMLEQRLGKTVYIENDANAAAYGEYVAGVGKDAGIMIMVTLGTGVGGGIVNGNEIYTGFNFAGAEMGHEVIVVDGRQCTCGRKGCFETYASATGLIKTTQEYMGRDRDSLCWDLCDGKIEKVSGRTAFDAMRQGDRTGAEVVRVYIRYLACGITNIINTFQPDLLCIGGGISHEGETLLRPLQELVAHEVYSRHSLQNTEIVAASLGNDAGVIGAAWLGFAK